ncbi:MAG: scyllo-inositol 2-dehydrogenase (NAD(+)) [Chloroflexota bacterium]|nr:MAG: scyllo-inositol 2-dehydrogenase (NAD(+)) [Chloroflexota bacterium]
MATINLGVIGLGRIGRINSRHLLGHTGGARLAAVSTRRPEAATQFLGQTGSIKIYPNYHDLLADRTLDGVLVVTHTHTHHDIVVAAAEAGKAIFCEKPIALTLAETDSMLAAVEKAGVLFQVGFMRRFDKGFAAAKRKIEAGEIGTPVVAQAMSRDPNCPAPDWAAPANSGGMILDLAIHDFDMLRWLMGDEVQRVYAEGSNLTCPDLLQVGDIDTAIINLRFINGGLGYVEAGRNCRYGYDIRCEIRGTEGTLKIGYLQDTPVLTLTPQGVTHDTVAWFEERFTPAYHAQLDHFIECIQQEKKPLAGANDARIALQISLAATLSQQQGMPVILIKDPLYLR